MTERPVVLRERARQDVEDAVDHYRTEAGEAVAVRFVDALSLALGHIACHPASGAPRIGQDLDLPGMRSWPLRRFPWLVFYAERADHLDVWRILHAERDLPAWLRAPDET